MKKIFSEKTKKTLIIVFVLWLILAIVFVLPIAVGAKENTYNGVLELDGFTSNIASYLLSINSRIKAFNQSNINNTMTVIGYYSVFYYGIVLVMFLKNKDKGSYHNIEHGSSDWSEGGEQYKVLSKKDRNNISGKKLLTSR